MKIAQKNYLPNVFHMQVYRMIRNSKCKFFLNRKLKAKFLLSDVVEDRLNLRFDVWRKDREKRIEGLAYPGDGPNYKHSQFRMTNIETKNMLSRSNIVVWRKEGQNQYSRWLNSLSHFREGSTVLKQRSRP